MGPDGVMRPASVTFDTKLDADAWLKSQTSDVDRGMWQAPDAIGHGPVPTLKDYAETWLAGRDLKPSSLYKYRSLLDHCILPGLGPARLDRITPTSVRNWHSSLSAKTPARKAHAYALLRVIMATAFADEVIKSNPCRIRGAGQNPPRKINPKGATLAELETMVGALDDVYRLLVLLAAWCALRYGELAELRRVDIDLDAGVIYVTRAVTHISGKKGGTFVLPPKTEAGLRAVAIPPHLLPVLQRHLDTYVGPKSDALLWTSKRDPQKHLTRAAFQPHWKEARAAAGRPDLRFHDLRHTGATLAAASGATIKELMHRLGHTTAAAAMIYQEAAHERDKAIAAALSEFATGGGKVVPLRQRAK